MIKIPLTFVPMGPISNEPVLVQIMAWCRTGDKPLCESMAAKLTYAHASFYLSDLQIGQTNKNRPGSLQIQAICWIFTRQDSFWSSWFIKVVSRDILHINMMYAQHAKWLFMYTEVTRRSSDTPFGPEILNHLTKCQAFILKTDSTPSAYVIHQASTQRPRQNGRHFAGARRHLWNYFLVWKLLYFLFTFVWNLFVSKDPINYKPVLI